MALEASIVERLQELRRWQAEQQERLLQHQQEQRETLSREQGRMYQALGLSVQNESREESGTEPVFQDSLDDSGNKNKPMTKKYENLLRTRIGDVSPSRHMSPQKRHELLHNSSLSSVKDECIPRNDQDIFDKRSAIVAERNQVPFKGENEDSPEIGIDFEGGRDISDSESINSRRIVSELSIEGVEPLPLVKPTRKSLVIDDIPVPSPRKDFHTLLEESLKESEYAPGNDASETNKTGKTIKRPFLKKGQGLARFRLGQVAESSAKQMRPRTMSLPSSVRMENSKGGRTNTEKSNDDLKAVKKRAVKTEKGVKKTVSVPSRAQSRLNLKNVQPPVRVRSKSMCNPREACENEFVENDRFSNSDIESKTKREMEEVRIFELLEEKAENSSFCSTSSTVVALLQQSVQSTPLKAKKSFNKNKISTVVENWRNEQDDTNEDSLLAEIVYTTKSNSTVYNSSQAYQKQYQNDFRQSQNSKDPKPDEKLPRQFENDDAFDDNSIDNIGELPYGTDIDPNYDADFPPIEQTNYANDKDLDRQVHYEKNTSLHVRFSEYNEYKTIGLTDTSTISNDSEAPRLYSDQRAWSDCSATTDSSDAEEFTSIIQSNKFQTPDSHGTLKNNSKTLQSAQISGKHYENRFYNDKLDRELTGGQREDQQCGNHSEFKVQTNEPYNYHGEATDDDVTNSGSEQDDDNVNSEAQNEVSALADSTLVEERSELVKTQEENGLIFKSELLKTRLLELEREIEIFRKENIAVTTLKEKLQEERRALERNFKEKENRFEERRLKSENALQEEKKRLMREKAALENRLKDAHVKAQQGKQERIEIQSLRDQIEELKDEMNQKESRWNAAQARQRSQVRILQSENSKLKQEIEKLRNTRKANTKARLHAKHVPSSNTKAIHQINRQLESQKQMPRKMDSSSDEEEFLMQPMMEAMNLNEPQNSHDNIDRMNSDGSRMIVYDRTLTESKNRAGIARKRDLYQNLLKDATMGLKEGEEATKKAVQSLENTRNLSKSNEQLANPVDEIIDVQDHVDHDGISAESGFHQRENLASCRNEFIAETSEAISQNSNNAFENYTRRENSSDNCVPLKETENTSGLKKTPNSKNDVKVDKQGIREVRHPDGRLEFWYPNGNVKKISADGTITKLIYYNGDVCESRKDGSVKYFYATTRTWHTTMSDGLEILEFPDGQVERRSKDGTVEVSFPDGSVRILQSNGTEKWALPDGTLAETSADGEKILTLPNGQREVHTKEHKRREYPDGTVKLVYPDGSQETRYASGRVRLKDKDGNLLMDSHYQ